MPPEEIQSILRRRPFEPFRIHLSDGRSYLIRHPDAVLVGKRVLVLGLPSQEANRATEIPFDRSETVALIHITSVEPLPAQAG